MATRRMSMAFLGLLATTATIPAAEVRTTNFVVVTARQDDAEEFARLAEHFRKVKAVEWLGKEMPPWRQPCRLRVDVTNAGAGGATTFEFDEGTVRKQDMQIKGARERLKNSVLPHEITHTVFAYHFRRPVPRWADEGGSVYSEDDIERARHDRLVKQILNAGDGIQLKALFQMREYPDNVMALYAQGYSVTKFLVEQSDRQTFLNFVSAGMQNGWDGASREFYSFKSVQDLEEGWIAHLKKVARGDVVASSGRRAPPPPADTKLTVFDSTPPARPVFEPAPVTRGLSPVGRGDDRFSNDIGWNRPKARLMEPTETGPAPADMRDLPPAPRTSGSFASRAHTPAAVLLPPEPAPYR